MAKRRVWVIGSGKRVLDAILPGFASLEESFELHGILARTAKTVESGGREYAVEPLETLTQNRLAPGDLIFMAVAKGAVPEVLGRLSGLGVESVDLLIDTPVLQYKHMGHIGRMRAFRNVWVSEDTTRLPCFDPVHEAIAAGRIGDVERVIFTQSAYAYHGFAMGKTILGRAPVRRASRKSGRRSITFKGGGELVIVEPRDYRIGRMRFEGTAGAIADEAGSVPEANLLSAMVENGACTGFRVGEVEAVMDAAERSLMGTPLLEGGESGSSAGVTVWMEGQKRVGFLRLLREILDGQGAYPLNEALDDTVVDYHLEKVGFYLANPLTSPRFSSGRWLLKGLSALVRS